MKKSLRQKVLKLVENDHDISLRTVLNQFKDEKYNSVRTYYTQAKKKYIVPGEKKKNKKTAKFINNSQVKVDETLIEKSILELYNRGKLDVNLIRLMTDYVLKIKGKSEAIDEDLDMEMLKSIGLSIKDSDKI